MANGASPVGDSPPEMVSSAPAEEVGYRAIPGSRSIRLISTELSNYADTLTRYLLTAVLGALVVDVFAQVISRDLLRVAIPWSEEVATYLFIWLTFLGAAAGIKEKSHPSVGILVERLPLWAQRQVGVAGRVGASWFFAFLVVEASRQAISDLSTSSPMLQIPLAWVDAAPVVAGLLMLAHLSADFVRDKWDARDVATVVGSLAVLGFVTVYLRGVNVYAFIGVALACLILGRVPVSVALGLVTLLAMSVNGQASIIVVQRMLDGLNNFTLLAIPFFMLTGAIMAGGTIASRLASFANALVGWLRGGLGFADILVSIIFADISGSAVADTAAIGTVMLPNLIRRGYDRNFATALQASAGSLGMQFPPSITMIIYAWVASVSVATLFAASLIPGLLVAGSLAVVVYVVARRQGYPREGGIDLRLIGTSFRHSLLALVTPAIILGGIFSGAMTATESGVIAVVYSLIVSLILYRDLRITALPRIMTEAAVGVARVTFMVATAIALSWLLIVNQGPQQVAVLIYSLSQDPLVDVLLINLVLVVLHMMLEPTATMLVVVPVLLPLLNRLGIDPVVFGVIFVINSAIGFLTPPIGFCLYIACGVSGAKLEAVTRAIVPFVLVMWVDLLLVVTYPEIALFVPHLLRLH